MPTLISEIYHKGFHVYLDNWYTSEKLFKHLRANGTVSRGTARYCRLLVPTSLQRQKLERDEDAYRQDGKILMMKYQDNKKVYFLSSIYQANSKPTGKKKGEIDVVKPAQVQYYTKYMAELMETMQYLEIIHLYVNPFYLFANVIGSQRLLQFN